MVHAGRVNVCGVCGCELLGRDEVEAIVTGKERVYVAREHMLWETYSNGNTYMYAEFNGVTGSRGRTKNIVCGCTAVRAETPSMTIVREEFREHVRELFGETLSVPLLFSLPVSMVAWEYCGMVRALPSDEGLLVADDGMTLIDIVADMSRLGFFNGTVTKFDEQDIMQGFTYLYMIRPAYRPFVATDFGPSVSWDSLFARVPLDWFDWPQMLALRCDSVGDGTVNLARVAGVPLIDETARFLMRGIVEMKGKIAVCAGTQVTCNNTCVQFLPFDRDQEHDPPWGSGLNVFEVAMSEGTTFVPAGPVLLHGVQLAVTFEPGVAVRTSLGTLVSAPHGAVTIFLNGTVEVELVARAGEPVFPPVFTAGGVSGRMYQVGAVCESYAPDTRLGRWHGRRFDVLSTSARFFENRAEFLLLSNAKVDRSGAVPVLFNGGTVADNEGAGLQRAEMCQVSFGDKYLLESCGMVLRGGVAPSFSARVVVNGVIDYGENVALALLTEAVITFRDNPSVYVMSHYGAEFAFPVVLECALPLDDYVIDRGGPSGSEGEYFDDTFLCRSSNAIDVLVGERMIRDGSVTGGTFTVCNDALMPVPLGLTYVQIAKHAPTMAHALGYRPKFRELLLVPVAVVDTGMVQRSGWVRAEVGWRLVVGGKYVMTWKELAVIAYSWFVGYERKCTLLGYLLDLYQVVVNNPLLVSDRCG